MKVIRNEELEYRTFGVADDFADLADKVITDAIESIETGSDKDDAISWAIEANTIYYSDQWEVMMAYQVPATADYEQALEDFHADISQCIEIEE